MASHDGCEGNWCVDGRCILKLVSQEQLGTWVGMSDVVVGRTTAGDNLALFKVSENKNMESKSD
jgi:hypothetical protein